MTDRDLRDAEKLLDACCLALAPEFDPIKLRQALSHIRSEEPSRLWLDAIGRAIDAAEIDPLDRAGLRGAFRVAAVVLREEYDRFVVSRREAF